MQRNIKSMVGFVIAATYGELGKVDGFYFDDETISQKRHCYAVFNGNSKADAIGKSADDEYR